MKVQADFAVVPYELFCEMRRALTRSQYGVPNDSAVAGALVNQVSAALTIRSVTVEFPDPQPATVAAAAHRAAVGEGRS